MICENVRGVAAKPRPPGAKLGVANNFPGMV
jgi:hypothetical protein